MHNATWQRRTLSTGLAVFFLSLAVAGCGNGGGEEPGRPDGGPADAGDVDAGDTDGSVPDGGADGGATDGGTTDGGGEADGGQTSALGTGPLYVGDRTHSPITPAVTDRLEAVVGGDTEARVFAKVGDSISHGSIYMFCFADPEQIDLAGRDHLTPTIEWFRAGEAAGTTPYDRVSEATKIGMHANEILQQDGQEPSRLDRELDALDPTFATVMLGTNDVGWRELHVYASDMWDILDRLLAEGVVPVLSTIPPRETESPDVRERVPEFNAVVRGLAQGLRVPLVDLYPRMLDLPDHGLTDDRMHPSGAWDVSRCDFTSSGLQYGYNLRNLLSIEGLDRARRAALAGEVLDSEGAEITGTGTSADPILVPGLPFTNLRNLSEQGAAASDTWPGCDLPASGPELRWSLTLGAGARVVASVFARAPAEAAVFVVDDAGSCLGAATDTLELTLEAGTYQVVVDSPEDAAAGETLLTLIAR